MVNRNKNLSLASPKGGSENKILSCKQTYIGLALAWLLSLAFVPQISLMFVLLNMAVMVTITILQFYSAALPRKKLVPQAVNDQTFVSIHIPTHNEPPELVIKALEALHKLNYEQFEVIVLDNNTKDPQVWRPVEEACKKLGEKFQFRHIDNMEGYKAGALNVCSDMSHPATAYILVIDADYMVQPELLEVALGHFSDDRVGLVQFPQAYVNTGKENRGMHGEYDHFFDVYMNMANHYNCVLSTGTVSVIRKKALEEVGGWSSSTITEDCELGLRLHQSGFRGVYVPQPLGKGLMPTDLKALQVQRERWVFGNMQTLMKFLRLSKDKLSLSQCTGILTQLTAWFNFLLIPVIGAVSGGIGLLLGGGMVYQSMVLFSLLSVWLYLLGKFLFFRLAFRHRTNSLAKAVDAYLVHLGTAWEGALSWMRCLCGENLRFKRTNKFMALGGGIFFSPNLIFSGLLLLSGACCLVTGFYAEWVLAWLAAPAFVSVYFLKRLTTKTYQLTESQQAAAAA